MEINIQEKLCTKLVLFTRLYKDCTRMHGQQNIKKPRRFRKFRKACLVLEGKENLLIKLRKKRSVIPKCRRLQTAYSLKQY